MGMYTDFCFKVTLQGLTGADRLLLESRDSMKAGSSYEGVSQEALAFFSDRRAAFLFRSGDLGYLHREHEVTRKLEFVGELCYFETHGQVKNHQDVIAKFVQFLAKYAVTGFGYSLYEEYQNPTSYLFENKNVSIVEPENNYEV